LLRESLRRRRHSRLHVGDHRRLTPAGTQSSAQPGRITGTPMTTETFTFSVQPTDSRGVRGTRHVRPRHRTSPLNSPPLALMVGQRGSLCSARHGSGEPAQGSGHASPRRRCLPPADQARMRPVALARWPRAPSPNSLPGRVLQAGPTRRSRSRSDSAIECPRSAMARQPRYLLGAVRPAVGGPRDVRFHASGNAPNGGVETVGSVPFLPQPARPRCPNSRVRKPAECGTRDREAQ
jgi:hypothetical protein